MRWRLPFLLLPILSLSALAQVNGTPVAPPRASAPTVSNPTCFPKFEDYPASAREQKISGFTRIRYRVDASGMFTSAEIINSSGTTEAHSELDKLALERIKTCNFKPATNHIGSFIEGVGEVNFYWRAPSQNNAIKSPPQFQDRDACLKDIWSQARKTLGLDTKTPTAYLILVGVNGEAKSVQIAKSAGAEAPIRTIEDFAKQYFLVCKFKPAMSNEGILVESNLPISLLWPKADLRAPAIVDPKACAPKPDDYPPSAIREEAQGKTRIRFVIDAAGRVSGSEVIKSAGSTRVHRILDRVAQQKLSECQFRAAMDEKGQPIGGSFEVEYIWKINGIPFYDSAYTSPEENIKILRSVLSSTNELISIGSITTDGEIKPNFGCRLTTIKPTNGASLPEYISHALAVELSTAQYYKYGARISINSIIQKIDVSTVNETYWDFVAKFTSSISSREILINERYNYLPKNSPCDAARDQFKNALASMLLSLYSHPDFPELVGRTRP